MNNAIGLLIAVSLAMIAGVLNWNYLETKSKEIEMVSFVAIDEDVSLKPGDTFLEKHLVPLDVPQKRVGFLNESAVLYEDRFTVIGLKAVREYQTGDVILLQELKTPPAELNLNPNEDAVWIPVDGGSFVSSLVSPGDTVSFYVAAPTVKSIVPAVVPPEGSEEPAWDLEGGNKKKPNQPMIYGGSETIGPFRIISLGGRLGSFQVSRASGASSGQENVIGIAVTKMGDRYEPNAERLLQRINSAGFRKAGVLLHPRAE